MARIPRLDLPKSPMDLEANFRPSSSLSFLSLQPVNFRSSALQIPLAALKSPTLLLPHKLFPLILSLNSTEGLFSLLNDCQLWILKRFSFKRLSTLDFKVRNFSQSSVTPEFSFLGSSYVIITSTHSPRGQRSKSTVDSLFNASVYYKIIFIIRIKNGKGNSRKYY